MKQTINIGTVANDGTGDPLRSAFSKTNDNFSELYNGQSLSIVSDILTLTRADGTTSTVDLSSYLDEDARAIASGTLNGGTGIVTFTRDDASTFTLDLSALLDDTNVVTSVDGGGGLESDTTTGDITISISDGGVTFAKLATSAVVTQAEGISSNNNDTTIPTSAAVANYVATNSSDTLGGLFPTADYFVIGTGSAWTTATPSQAKASLVLDTTDDVTFNSLFASTIGLDSTDYITWTDNTQMDFYVNNLNQMRLEADGDLHVEGDVIAASTTVSSDENLKKDISKYKDALKIISELKGVSFAWKSNGKKSGGVIAQDVEKVLPELVGTKKSMKNDGEETLTVDYNGLIGVLIQAVKELSHKVEKLEKR